MNYLLDTNACIALINGKPAAVRAKFQKATDAGAQVFVSSMAYDLLMAGRAMRNKLVLITANLSEFARIKGLAWADRAKDVR